MLTPYWSALSKQVACFIIINSPEATNNKMDLGLPQIPFQGATCSHIQAILHSSWPEQKSYSEGATLPRVTEGMVVAPELPGGPGCGITETALPNWAWLNLCHWKDYQPGLEESFLFPTHCASRKTIWKFSWTVQGATVFAETIFREHKILTAWEALALIHG